MISRVLDVGMGAIPVTARCDEERGVPEAAGVSDTDLRFWFTLRGEHSGWFDTGQGKPPGNEGLLIGGVGTYIAGSWDPITMAGSCWWHICAGRTWAVGIESSGSHRGFTGELYSWAVAGSRKAPVTVVLVGHCGTRVNWVGIDVPATACCDRAYGGHVLGY